MKLEDQVVSLDLAKRLKELGVKQESLFYWKTDATGVNKNSSIGFTELIYKFSPFNPQNLWERFSAFTVAELGEMLPVKFDTIKRTDLQYWVIENTEDDCESCGEPRMRFFDKTIAATESDARAKMLCYLLENKPISFDY